MSITNPHALSCPLSQTPPFGVCNCTVANREHPYPCLAGLSEPRLRKPCTCAEGSGEKCCEKCKYSGRVEDEVGFSHNYGCQMHDCPCHTPKPREKCAGDCIKLCEECEEHNPKIVLKNPHGTIKDDILTLREKPQWEEEFDKLFAVFQFRSNKVAENEYNGAEIVFEEDRVKAFIRKVEQEAYERGREESNPFKNWEQEDYNYRKESERMRDEIIREGYKKELKEKIEKRKELCDQCSREGEDKSCAISERNESIDEILALLDGK